MAKYLIAFILLAFLALENNHIYNRLHAKSHPSGTTNDAVTHFMRQHQYRQHPTHAHNKHYPAHEQHQAHHSRKHIKHQKHNFDRGQEDDDTVQDATRDMERVKRHMEHKKQQILEHNRRLQQKSQRPTYSAESLKTMPRIWQHLSMVYDYDYSNENDRMYGDSPVEDVILDTDESNIKIEIPMSVEEKDQEEEVHEKEEGEEEEELEQENKSTRCPKCESNRKVQHVTEEELTRLRIEYVKQQILEKLRLKERPNVSAVDLPKPIYEGVTIEQEEDTTDKKDLDDFYARTSKKFIFLEVGKCFSGYPIGTTCSFIDVLVFWFIEKTVCRKLSSQPSMCFSFKIDDADADGYDVSTAVLWLFKNTPKNLLQRNDTLLTQQTIVVSEVQQQLDSKYLPVIKTIAIQSVDVQGKLFMP